MIVQVNRKGKAHRSNDFIAAIFGYWYPASEQLIALKGKTKIATRYDDDLRDWLVYLQSFALNPTKALEIFDVNQGLFNQYGNSYYEKNNRIRRGLITRGTIPLVGKLPERPLAQGITSDDNYVNVLDEQGKWAIIECIDPNDSKRIWRVTPKSHKHLFCAPFTAVQVKTGNYAFAVGGAVFPLLAPGGKARMLKTDLKLPKKK